VQVARIIRHGTCNLKTGRSWGITMADNNKKTLPQDPQRVNLKEDDEIVYWMERFDCSRERLEAAVKKVGVMADNVEKELNSR
jgi:hypothetical protein